MIPLLNVIDYFDVEGRELPDRDVGPVLVVDGHPNFVLTLLLLTEAGAASRAGGAGGRDARHCRNYSSSKNCRSRQW